MFDRRLLSNFDWIMVLLTLTISLLGVLSIYSASKGYSGNPQYWLKQLYWLGIGLGGGFVVLLVDFRTIGQWSYVFHGLVTLSLVFLLVLSSGSGQVDRWFMIGPVAVQPSEFVKFTSVLAVAYYLRDGRRVGNLGLKGIWFPAILVLVPFLLIVNQPDLGTALLLPIILIPMIILAGLRLRLLIYLIAIGILAVVALVASFQMGVYRVEPSHAQEMQRLGFSESQVQTVSSLAGNTFQWKGGLEESMTDLQGGFEDQRLLDAVAERSFKPYISFVLRPYQQRRLLTFVNPEADPLGAGYHVIQSRVAIGSGGFTGKGFGESTQGSLNFLPARHTDFVFSIYAEEWGFLGAFLLLMLFAALIYRSLSILFQTHDRFSAFVTVGITSIIGFQALINTGMAAGLLPVVGVPLPFFSYGGSSMITLWIGIALLLNIRMRRFLWV